jgi:hypothetical protein
MDISELTINPEILEKNGYRSFNNNMRSHNNPAYKISYQKRFDDEFGKKYFITFDFTHYKPGMFGNDSIPEDMSWEADVQLNTLDDGTINLTYFGAKNHKLEQVETFFETQFNTYLYKHYEYDSSHTLDDYLEFIDKQKIGLERQKLEVNISNVEQAPKTKKRKAKI